MEYKKQSRLDKHLARQQAKKKNGNKTSFNATEKGKSERKALKG